MVQADYLNVDIVFDMAMYLKNETDFLPWQTFINRIEFFIYIFNSPYLHSYKAKFQNYLLDIIKPIYNSLAWKTDLTWVERLKFRNILLLLLLLFFFLNIFRFLI